MSRSRVILALATVATLAATVAWAKNEKVNLTALPADDQSQTLFSAPTGHSHAEHGSSMKQFFALIFPFDSPAYNSILATFYISS